MAEIKAKRERVVKAWAVVHTSGCDLSQLNGRILGSYGGWDDDPLQIYRLKSLAKRSKVFGIGHNIIPVEIHIYG